MDEILTAVNNALNGCLPKPATTAEVVFRVRPIVGEQNPEVVFSAELLAGGVKHTFPATFTATADVNFVIENAAPPYGGTFTVSEGSRDIEVALYVAGGFDISADSAGPAHPAVVGTITPAAAPPVNEVRFEVCVASDNAASCGIPGRDSGVFGLPFNGSVGDAFNPHVIGGITPSIFFLEDARDSVNGVFALAPSTGQKLIARLYVNGELIEAASDTGEVVLKHDL